MKIKILGVYIDTMSMKETVGQISESIATKQNLRVVTANPEMIYQAGSAPKLMSTINSADLVTADGIGVVWAAQQLGTPLKERVTGIDLLEHLFPEAQSAGWRIFLLGSKPGVAETAISKIESKYPNIILEAAHGYFEAEEEAQLLTRIEKFQPDLLLVGLGSPRQEYWLAEHENLAIVGIGVGGSFDALAEMVPRAPQRFRELHLEWFYRLCQEPRRWQRQLVLPKFVMRVLKEKNKKFR